jgi:hypothetical protein
MIILQNTMNLNHVPEIARMNMIRITSLILAGLLLTVLLIGGCSGILAETDYKDGKSDRLRVEPGSKWSSWDQNSTKEDDKCLLLKGERTF